MVAVQAALIVHWHLAVGEWRVQSWGRWCGVGARPHCQLCWAACNLWAGHICFTQCTAGSHRTWWCALWLREIPCEGRSLSFVSSRLGYLCSWSSWMMLWNPDGKLRVCYLGRKCIFWCPKISSGYKQSPQNPACQSQLVDLVQSIWENLSNLNFGCLLGWHEIVKRSF